MQYKQWLQWLWLAAFGFFSYNTTIQLNATLKAAENWPAAVSRMASASHRKQQLASLHGVMPCRLFYYYWLKYSAITAAKPGPSENGYRLAGVIMYQLFIDTSNEETLTDK